MQAVITLPVIVAVTLIVVQLGVLWMAHNAAAAAAQDGAAAAAAYTAGEATGEATAQEFLRQTAGGLILLPDVRAHSDGQVVTVTVTGQAYTILPFMHLSVSVSQAAPIEKPAATR